MFLLIVGVLFVVVILLVLFIGSIVLLLFECFGVDLVVVVGLMVMMMSDIMGIVVYFLFVFVMIDFLFG